MSANTYSMISKAYIQKSNIAETTDVKKENVKKSDVLQSDNDKILTAMEEKEGEVIWRSVQGDRGDWQNLVEKLCQERKS